MPGNDPVLTTHPPTALRAVLVLALSGLLTAALLVLGARWVRPGLVGAVGDGSGAARTRAWLRTTGFHGPEYDAATGRQFSWTGSRARLIVPELDRQRTYRLTLRINAGRGPALPPPPVVGISVDGAPAVPHQTSNEVAAIDVPIPRSPNDRLVIAIDVPDAFVPGPADTRTLGVMVEGLTLTPDAGFRPTTRVVATAVAASLALAGALLLCGLRAPFDWGAALAIAASQSGLLLTDGAFLGATADALLAIAAGALAAGAGVAIARRAWAASNDRLDWALAAAVTILAVSLKLGIYVHPQASVGDGIFHVHRAQAVRAGSYFFTSITPRPFYEFPYPVALYVNALPLWRWFSTELELVHLLRGLAIVADGLIGLALFVPLRRWLGRATAFSFVILYPLVPIPAQALTAANLTNVYGQGVFGLSMAVVLWMAVAGRATLISVTTLTVLLTLALLSHFSTASVGIPMIAAVVLLVLVAGGRPDRRVGLWIGGALVAATAVAYLAYYAHFHDTYQTTFARIVAREGANEARSMAAPVAVKAARWWQEAGLNFGWPLLATAVGGLAALVAREGRAAPVLVLVAWLIAWAVFSLLGVVTPVEMRANLAAAPLMVALASIALGAIGRRSALGASVALTLAAFLAWRGLTVLVSALG